MVCRVSLAKCSFQCTIQMKMSEGSSLPVHFQYQLLSVCFSVSVSGSCLTEIISQHKMNHIKQNNLFSCLYTCMCVCLCMHVCSVHVYMRACVCQDGLGDQIPLCVSTFTCLALLPAFSPIFLNFFVPYGYLETIILLFTFQLCCSRRLVC